MQSMRVGFAFFFTFLWMTRSIISSWLWIPSCYIWGYSHLELSGQRVDWLVGGCIVGSGCVLGEVEMSPRVRRVCLTDGVTCAVCEGRTSLGVRQSSTSDISDRLRARENNAESAMVLVHVGSRRSSCMREGEVDDAGMGVDAVSRAAVYLRVQSLMTSLARSSRCGRWSMLCNVVHTGVHCSTRV